MSEAVILKIGGAIVETWKTVKVERSIDTVCSRFELTLSNPIGATVDLSAIADQAQCQLCLGDTSADNLVVTGFIDHVSDRPGQGVTIAGRDKTMDLVDCSAVHKPGWWRNQRLDAIVADLVKPFGVSLKVTCDTGAAFANFALEHGEAVYEAIVRLCQMRGVMVRSDPDGTLVIFTPSGDRASLTLELGRNILADSFTVDIDSSQRFSTYILKGQHHGGDFVSPKDAAQPSASADDPGMTRYRPLIIISQEQATPAGLQSRARWEATVRNGRSLRIGAAVRGWRDDAGKLFRPDTIVPLNAPQRGFNSVDMMIASLTYVLDGHGSRTSFQLLPPSAFTVDPLLEPKVKKSKHKGGLDYATMFGG